MGTSMPFVGCGCAPHAARAFAAAAGLALAACAAPPPAVSVAPELAKAPAARPHAAAVAADSRKTIAVVPAQYAPEVGIVAPSHAAAEAAAKGAAVGAAQGALSGMQFLVLGPGGVAAAIGMTLAYAALGAAYGVASVPPDTRIGPPVPGDATPGLRDRIATSVVVDIERFTPWAATIVPGIGPRSRDDVPDYRHMAAKGHADVVEVAVAQVGLAGQGGADPMFTLVVTTRARRVDTATGVATASRGLVYQSPRRTRDEWLREQGTLMRAEIARAQATLAGRVVDDLLLHAEFATEPYAERLPPLSLAWEARPPHAWPYDRVPWERAADLRYDLRIWSAEDHIPGDLVYERVGLAATSHTLQTALAPHASYFWSVRLRYTLDGEPRATRWSAASRPAFRFVLPMGNALFHAPASGGASPAPTCAPASFSPCACLDFIPAGNHLWFRTP